MAYPLIILGGGLAGLAAGIRFARFDPQVLILEQHSKIGGLNSYYHRHGLLFETGLHAITNFASPDDRHAPLNRLFRQLKLSRRQFPTHEQFASEIIFPRYGSLVFSNNFFYFLDEIRRLFPKAIDRFMALVNAMNDASPMEPQPWISARKQLAEALVDETLVDFLLCPLMFYGSSQENDMDFNQFIILFRSIFQEGFFRPAGSMKEFLDQLISHYSSFGGELRLKTQVARILTKKGRGRKKVIGVQLHSGEELFCDRLLSTVGLPETLDLLGGSRQDGKDANELTGRLSFMESLYILPAQLRKKMVNNRTILFYNTADRFHYRRPAGAIDTTSGVICFPDNFKGLAEKDTFQLRVTHLANYHEWLQVSQSADTDTYKELKNESMRSSRAIVGEIVGNFAENIVYEDSFTPVTIEKYTSRRQGAVYGSPFKIKNGITEVENLFLAGTDQGFLGIIGAMLSGVSMVNQHLLIAG